MRETLYTHTHAVAALAQASRTANTTVNGATVDLGVFKNNFRTVLFVVHSGAVTDGTHTFAVEDSANGSDWTAAPAAQVQGTAPVLDEDSDDAVSYLGYIVGTRRYVRLTVTTAGATSGGVFGAVAVLGEASSSPVARA